MAESLRDWRRHKRSAIEHRHTEHTREVVKVERAETLPADAVHVIQAVGEGTLQLKREVDELRAALEMIATHNAEQLRQVLDRVADVHRKSVDADNVLISELKALAATARKIA